MIVGLGTDIVEISRIEDSLNRLGDRFAQRILCDEEFNDFKASAKPARFLAKRFAAKEAAAKAFGTGIGHGTSWQHLLISHSELGAPLLSLKGDLQARSQALGIKRQYISISDERYYAVATVILES